MRFGIGATGLDRWKEYFKTVPRRTDAKFLLILHLLYSAPTRSYSLLPRTSRALRA